MLRIFKQYYPIRNALFVFGEGIAIFTSVIIATRLLLGESFGIFEYTLLLKALLITITCQVCLFYNDLYDLKITDTLTELSIRLLQALGASAIILALIYFTFPVCMITEGIFIISTAIVIIMIVSWRIGYTKILNRGLFNQKIMLLGSSDIAREIFAQVTDKKDCGYQITDIVTRHGWDGQKAGQRTNVIRQEVYENICELAHQSGVRKIIVALKEKRGFLPVKELLNCRVQGIEILEGNTFYEMLTGKLTVESINPSWLIYSEGFHKSKARRLIKRTTDLIVAFLMLIVLAPFIAVVALIIKLDSKGPVLFSQERVGENRKPYMVHKFRSMVSDAEAMTGPVWAQDNDSRITRVGHFIRKWRVDELPQLWNVLKGEMSFVGPRPEREHFVKELEAIIPYYGERFTVKPGLTGWAQVSYGYGASVEDAIEKLNYDLFYIKNMSTLMDFMIIAKTVKTVIFGHGR
ncbi:TIGR03013 family XrtA/PEP-CTERM system glycosyltransferase [Desulfatitalea tepidiphila]|uniref:TIGR03013 family XrtA/PEP-CTERM system glycosyltransferase n=1 Tax=Desulfatitalea tepidiphila TaxID=1185843 RepID=UPI0006B5E4D0|nr:TIGR03013 family XrtA/PEP-CTERM system glycosyltransferase [Desulfatitalea tepidiphila]